VGTRIAVAVRQGVNLIRKRRSQGEGDAASEGKVTHRAFADFIAWMQEIKDDYREEMRRKSGEQEA
jgi:hypothetical protein